MPAVEWWLARAVSRSTSGCRARALATAVSPRVVGVSGTLGGASVSGLTFRSVFVLSGLLAFSSALLLDAFLAAVGFFGGFLFGFLGFFGGFAVVLVGCALHLFEDG